MSDLPHLPAGPVAVVAVAGSVALLAFAAALGLTVASRRWRDVGWAAAVIVLAVLTMAAGRIDPAWHLVLNLCTLAAVLRNGVRSRGWARRLTCAGVAAWLVAVAQAYRIFH